MLRSYNRYGPPNTIDQLKLAALITMTLDHIGWYLLPQAMWLHIIGRVSFPVWLFVVGYHCAVQPTQDWQRLKRDALLLIGGSLLLVAADLALHIPLLPVPVLISILCVRALFAMPNIRNAIEHHSMPLLFFAVLASPLFFIMEYGSLALMFAMLGYHVRKNGISGNVKIIAIVGAICHVAFALLTFDFSTMQQCTLAILIAVMTYSLLRVKFGPWQWLAQIPKLARPVCFLTRNTYYYYVLHFLLLKIISALILHHTLLQPIKF